MSGGEKFRIVWICSAQSCSCSNIVLFVPLGELEPLHKERWSGSRLYHVGSCSAQSCLDSLILLFVLSERIRAVTQGDWSIFCTISLILSICRWNKTLNNVMERKKVRVDSAKIDWFKLQNTNLLLSKRIKCLTNWFEKKRLNNFLSSKKKSVLILMESTNSNCYYFFTRIHCYFIL